MALGVEAIHIEVCKVQVADPHIRRDRQPLFLGRLDHGHAPRGGQAAKMGRRPGLLDQQQGAVDGDRFRRFGDPGQSQAGADPPLMHGPVVAQVAVLRGDENRHGETGGVFQGPSQHFRVDHGPARVGKADATSLLQRRRLRESLSGQALGQGPQWVDARFGDAMLALMHQFNDGRGVGHGPGVRRAHHAGHAGAGGGFRFRSDGGLVFRARFAHMHAEVNNARTDALPLQSQLQVRREIRHWIENGNDFAIRDVHIARLVDPAGGTNDMAVPDLNAHRRQLP